ncbi:MAG: hypothetical protein ACM3SW_07645 [Actinomycetota bacterium]
MTEGIVGGLLLIWFVLSVLNQFDLTFFKNSVAAYDRFLLLPRYTFFAPNPGCTDYRLLYRDFGYDNQPSPWQEVLIVRKRSWLDAVWNPEKRLSKGLFDLTQAMLIIRREYKDPAVLMTSVPYIALAHYVECLPHKTPVKYRQFMIAQSHGYLTETAPETLATSGVHSVCY